MLNKNKFFLYGKKKTGKSTLLSKVVENLGVLPSGFKTISDSSSREGDWSLYLVPASGNIECNISNRVACCRADGTWESFTQVFNNLGVRFLTFKSAPQIIVMDEIGFMEEGALLFQEKILEILDGPYNVIGVIKPEMNDFIKKIYSHPMVESICVTGSNWNTVFEELQKKLLPVYIK